MEGPVLVCVLMLMAGSCLAQKIVTLAPWGFQTYIGSDIQVECNSTDIELDASDTLEWHTPKGHVISDSEKYVLLESGSVRGMYLKVKDVQDDDSGVYLCMIYRNNVFRAKINRGINIYRPLYRDNFDQYRHMTMVGGIAAACLFGAFCLLCFIYKCRYKSDEEREESRMAKRSRKYGHDNYGAEIIEAGILPVKHAPQNGQTSDEYIQTHL